MLAAILLKGFSFFSLQVERVYSAGIYPKISAVLRVLLGWIPFSAGDFLYAWVIVFLALQLRKIVLAIYRKQVTRTLLFHGFGRCINGLLKIYLAFNLLWGLNYDRLAIAYQLRLTEDKYTSQDLQVLADSLVQKLNKARANLRDTLVNYPANKAVYRSAVDAYAEAATRYPFLSYRYKSIKSSMYSKPGNYFGFLGYYNPFTGEAQVNVAVPAFLIPYITCHEMAHQLGYATEDEANFVGYLAAKSSPDPLFRYSVYFDLFSYANGELFLRDSVTARQNYRRLDTLVKKDYQTYRQYLKAYKNPIEPIIRLFYGQYLKANNQPKGIETYNDVVAWLLAYQKKYGDL